MPPPGHRPAGGRRLERRLAARFDRAQRWADRRLGATGPARAALRRAYPDHWSFLFGEIALYCLVVLVVTGLFLSVFYIPDVRGQITYQGPYAPLRGQPVTEAFNSVMRISFEVPAGLLVRQTHHWASLVFVAAVVLHLCRLFFTGAFRRPRERTWVVGVAVLLLAMLQGLAGHSLPDDLLSGTSLQIIWSAVLAIPVIGPEVAYLLFGGESPGPEAIPRLFVLHTVLLPALLIGLPAVHLGTLARHRRHPGPARGEGAGAARRPGRALASLGLLLLTAAVLTLLGGVAQINPVWQLGPYHPARVTSPAQPDWYLGFLDGLVRLAPPWSFELFGYTVSELLLPAVVFPAVAFGILTLWPFIERRLGGDRARHDLLDRPRDAPLRTAVGAAGLTMFLVAFVAAGNDILAVLLYLPLEAVTRLLQWLFVLGPVVVGLVTYAVCRSLRRSDLHPARAAAGLRLERTAAGDYRTSPTRVRSGQ
jgi:ubiquinol-cytochrome c reductase cytochrome b subunit